MKNADLPLHTWRLCKATTDRVHILKISVRARGAGIKFKMEGLLYLQKYGISGPEFGITERKISNRKGKAALPCQCMEQGGLLGAARPLTSANWYHSLASGFAQERRLLCHTITPSTNKLLTD